MRERRYDEVEDTEHYEDNDGNDEDGGVMLTVIVVVKIRWRKMIVMMLVRRWKRIGKTVVIIALRRER